MGYQAGSQGGWVAPLAAAIEPVDFVVVSFGLALSPLAEDREAVAFDMTRRGYGPDVLAKAMRVAEASAAVVASDFRAGHDQIAEVRARYGNEPWFRWVRGNVTFLVLQTPPDTLRVEGPRLFRGVPLHYDPMPVLRNLGVPQLWVLGREDTDAPIGETVRRLGGLVAAGRPVTVAVFPRAEHGLYEFETRADGVRVSTRAPDGYFAMMRDFIRDGRVVARYGGAVVTGARGRGGRPAGGGP